MKKIVALVLSLIMLISCFGVSVAEEPYKISVICTFYGENTPDIANSPAWKKIEELTNTEWDIT